MKTVILQALLRREETIHIVYRIPITEPLPANRPILRVPSPIIAVRAAVWHLTLPAQRSIRKLDVIILMLARDDNRVRQLAGERIDATDIDAVAYRDRVRGRVDRRVANVVALAVFEVDDRKQVTAVKIAVLRLRQVKGALSCGVGGGAAVLEGDGALLDGEGAAVESAATQEETWLL